MTIVTQIERLDSAKAAIKTAIIAKGVQVDDEKLDEYAELITQINTTEGQVPIPSKISFATSDLTELPNWLTSADWSGFSGNADGIFQNCRLLTVVEDIPWSVASIAQAFANDTALTTVKLTGMDNVTTTRSMFLQCSAMVSAPTTFTLSRVTNVNTMFRSCTALENVPQYNFPAFTTNTFVNYVSDCPKLTNDSLNNIMADFVKTTAETPVKTLRNLGFSETQAITAQELSNWGALQSAGWTTGY